MRTVLPAAEAAIVFPGAYKMYVRAEIQPSYVMLKAADLDNHSPAWAEPTGHPNPDARVHQCPVVLVTTGSALTYTFYVRDVGAPTHDYHLYYQRSGSDTVVEVTVGEDDYDPHQPVWVCGQSVFYFTHDFWLRRATLDLDKLGAMAGDCLTDIQDIKNFVIGGTAYTAYPRAIDEDTVVIWWQARGFICEVWHYSGSWSMIASTEDGFSFNMRWGSDERGSVANHFASAKLGDRYFNYVTNPETGMVEACWIDAVTGQASDFFVAVPTDVETSKCKFWVLNAYTKDDAIHLVGQFERTDVSGTVAFYTLILRSTDGINFAIDAFSGVSALGYGFRVLPYENDLYFAHCNRTGHKPMTWVYSPTTGSALHTLSIDQESVLSFDATGADTANLAIAVGNESLMKNANILEGARANVYVAYAEAGADPGVFTLFGTYIIDSLARSRASGKRVLTLNLVNLSVWELTGFCSPYYAEILSKASCYTDFPEDSTALAAAGEGCFVENAFAVDFWSGTGYRDGGGITYESGSGVEHETLDLDEVLGSNGLPEAYGTFAVRIYGWSRIDDDAPGNGSVHLRITYIDEDGNEQTEETASTSFQYNGGGALPIVQTGILLGSVKLKRVAAILTSGAGGYFCISRVEFYGAIRVAYLYKSSTPWERQDDAVGGVKVPGINRPFIMQAIKPAVANDFIIAGKFKISYTDAVGGYPIACGLVGHMLDSQNYKCWRFDIAADAFHFVHALNGTETVLATISRPSDKEVTLEMMYRCKGTTHSLYEKKSGVWEYQGSYQCHSEDATSEALAKSALATKVGIYGTIRGPYFRTVGYAPSAAETSEYVTSEGAYGVPMLPGFSQILDFPASGQFQAGDELFSYNGKTGPAATYGEWIRGPYQLRQWGQYEEPYGNGYGLESRDCWLPSIKGETEDCKDSLCALDNGINFLIDRTEWEVYITTGGVRQNLYNRCRHYKASEFGIMSGELSTRVYATCGLINVQAVEKSAENSSIYIPWGTEIHYHTGSEIRCLYFWASDGQIDVTVRDLIDRVHRVSGALATFPGDKSQSFDYVGSATDDEQDLWTIEDADFLDLHNTFRALAVNEYVRLDLGVSAVEGDSILSVNVKRVSDASNTLYECSLTTGSALTLLDRIVVKVANGTSFSGTISQRLVMHDNFITLYLNNIWAHTFHLEEIVYPTAGFGIDSYVYHLTDLSIVFHAMELADWREAIYIDLESDGKSAISSIIQERPVEIVARSDGSMTYWYEPTRAHIDQLEATILEHDWQETIPRESASDAILYYESTASVQNTDYFERYGLRTRLLRLSNLSSGAVRAGRILLRRALEARVSHSLRVRPDTRLEIGDILHVIYVAAGSGGSEDLQVILEGISMSIRKNAGTMSLTGRGAL